MVYVEKSCFRKDVNESIICDPYKNIYHGAYDEVEKFFMYVPQAKELKA